MKIDSLLCRLFGHKFMPELGNPRRICVRCSFAVGKTYEEVDVNSPLDHAIKVLESED